MSAKLLLIIHFLSRHLGLWLEEWNDYFCPQVILNLKGETPL